MHSATGLIPRETGDLSSRSQGLIEQAFLYYRNLACYEAVFCNRWARFPSLDDTLRQRLSEPQPFGRLAFVSLLSRRCAVLAGCLEKRWIVHGPRKETATQAPQTYGRELDYAGLALVYVARTLIPQISTIQQVF